MKSIEGFISPLPLIFKLSYSLRFSKDTWFIWYLSPVLCFLSKYFTCFEAIFSIFIMPQVVFCSGYKASLFLLPLFLSLMIDSIILLSVFIII